MGNLDIFTNPSVFLIIGGVGLLVLILAAILDGVLDVFEFDGPVSLTTIAAFLALFGFVAAGLEYAGVDITWTILISAAAGALAAVGAWGVSRFFKDDTSTSASHSVNSIIGKEAYVRLRIRQGGYGEIGYRQGGHMHTYAAQSETDIEEGEKVTIVSIMSDTRVFVEPVAKPETETPETSSETSSEA